MAQLSALRRALLSSEGSNPSKGGKENVKWVEGVRGVASFFVVVTHLCRAWDYTLWFPRDNEHAAPKLLQLPFLRLPWQGRIGVTMFAFLTGYVCAIKPLRQVKSGNMSGALTTLGKSAFRRPPRLIMPATVALIIAWLFAQLGGFKVSSRCDAAWLRHSSPKDIGSLDTEIPRLFHNFQTVWLSGRQEYDDHQWALLPLLQGAFTIYVTLFATLFMKVRFRLLTVSILFMWYWLDPRIGRETFECQFLYGVLLCDIGSEPRFRQWVNEWTRTRRAIQTSLIILGIYVASYPGERPEWADWSAQLHDIGDYIFPAGTAEYHKRWSAVGWCLMVVGIWMSPTMQGIFSNKLFMWFGRNSFAVYLTHGTVLRVFAARMIYGWSGEPFSITQNENGDPVHHWLKRSGPLTFMVAIPVFFVVEYTIAHYWTTYVDAWCAKATKLLEDAMFESEDEKSAMQSYA
ncbi:hypothetical protein K491DRAFT_733970 [Lophiostoma macrostomum CBS 122681]|uniref:Acyltransferase 3 domain-containing protein n=1 Tax=Lophiostoma macrostomum CBS 122681 TaxID=1314788 RepID=A0A6A6TS18_9PLEO|nr:hypothetical protein K491DRAFT_733970 [Lophiostoma macrostomum CBS 122681]